MPLESLLKFVPVFVLVLVRVGAFMLMAPLFGSGRIPKRIKAMLALVMAWSFTPLVAAPVELPTSLLAVAIGIAGEMMFGLAMGLVLSLVFIAAQWAGEMIGQQIGFDMAETFDPSFAGSSTIVGDLYYMLTLIVFLAVGGHREMLWGVRDSFRVLPLLSVGMNEPIFKLVTSMLQAATELAFRLAAPVMVTMMIVELTLGFLGKTMPQLNVAAMAQSVKAVVGVLVIVLGLTIFSTTDVLKTAIDKSVETVRLVLGTSPWMEVGA